MAQVADFSSPQSLTAIKEHFSGIIRYVSDFAPKNITPDEFNRARSLGLSVALICEQGRQPALRGAAGGQHDAAIANEQADEVGYDRNATIYYVAEDPNVLPRSSWPIVEDYFRALSGRPRGAYGGLALVTNLMNKGLASKGWVVQTWGGTSPQVHLEQLVEVNTFGLVIDVDNVLQADFGQHPRPVGPTPTDAPTGGEMGISTAVSFRAGQVDVFQVKAGTLWHKWDIAGNWSNESVAKAAGLNPQPTFPDQVPSVSLLGGQCIVTVEDDGGRGWFFSQNAKRGGWGVAELP